ncbi:MAG: hypothetical protein M3144_09685, partial [Actinomycetota bacterium]|nr:hypothetical protein [Actinomycetota bacterium]
VRALAAAIPATARPREPAIEISMEEILEDLCWPGPPPGRWLLAEPTPTRTAHDAPEDLAA